MRDGTSPEYFAVGVILIILFFIWSLNNNKKNIEQGKGNKVDNYDYWGNPSTHQENFDGGKITFGIFLLVLLYIILTK